MRFFGYPYNDLVICKDSPNYLLREKLLSNLNASKAKAKAAGPDQLSGKLLKATACESAQILQVIFQRSLNTEKMLLV